MGELGIAPRHSPLLTVLVPGEIRVVQQDEIEVLMYVSGGYVEVQPHLVTVLADVAVRAENIDEQRAQSAREKAEQIIANGAIGISYAQARAELVAACAQLKTLDDLRNRRRKKH